jgi:hypothetical protein
VTKKVNEHRSKLKNVKAVNQASTTQDQVKPKKVKNCVEIKAQLLDIDLFESIAIDKTDIGQAPPNPFTAQVPDTDLINMTTKIDNADE